MWPFICQFIEKLFRETIEPAVRGAHAHLSTFSFTRVDLGQQVCFLPGSLTCAPLERTLSHLRLFSGASCFWKAGCGRTSPPVSCLGVSALSGPRLLRLLGCLCQSRSICGPLDRTFCRHSHLRAVLPAGGCRGSSLLINTSGKEPPPPPPCSRAAARGSSAGLAAPR